MRSVILLGWNRDAHHDDIVDAVAVADMVADREGVVHVTQSKTRATPSSPVQPALAAISDATPTNHLTFLVTNYGSLESNTKCND